MSERRRGLGGLGRRRHGKKEGHICIKCFNRTPPEDYVFERFLCRGCYERLGKEEGT